MSDVKVALSKTTREQLAKVPAHVVRKSALWEDLVEGEGLEAARAIPGFRDHPLQGEWKGYHAVRLSQAYGAISIVKTDQSIETVFVEEANKHDY